MVRTVTTATTAAGVAGAYSFASVPAGLGYTLAPAPSAIFSYTPAQLTVASLTSNATQNFTAARKLYAISGRVLQAGSATAGVSDTLRPSKAGATFSPASKSYANLSANQSAQNFSSP